MTDLQHPLLRDDERARAFELIVTGKPSTLRSFAELLGWTLPRVQRFVNTLERERLAIVIRSRWGTALTQYTPDTHPIQPPGSKADTHPIHSRHAPDTPPIRLGSKALDQLPRSRAGNDFIADLIDGMNQALAARFGDEYRIVLYDNKSSNKAGLRLQRLGIDSAWALTELWKAAQLFHPEKNGNGLLPRSLAYFAKGLEKKWAERDQLVATRLVTTVERSTATTPAPDPDPPKQRLMSAQDAAMMSRFKAKRDARSPKPTVDPIGDTVVDVVARIGLA